ncbi:MAG: hypothetical protein FD129_3180 [bacterium]|nr:MAG: hypothetical protein FD129_3180 [bacterium]
MTSSHPTTTWSNPVFQIRRKRLGDGPLRDWYRDSNCSAARMPESSCISLARRVVTFCCTHPPTFLQVMTVTSIPRSGCASWKSWLRQKKSIIETATIRFVPQRGWTRGFSRTAARVSSSPASSE